MDLKSMISGYNSFLRLLIVLLLMTASYCFGRVQQDSDIANLTAEVTGTLPVANGGTNISSFTAGDLLYASGTTALSKLAKGLQDKYLL